jgi:hypothetical protein
MNRSKTFRARILMNEGKPVCIELDQGAFTPSAVFPVHEVLISKQPSLNSPEDPEARKVRKIEELLIQNGVPVTPDVGKDPGTFTDVINNLEVHDRTPDPYFKRGGDTRKSMAEVFVRDSGMVEFMEKSGVTIEMFGEIIDERCPHE